MTRKQRRLVMIGTAVAVLGLALGLVLYAMRDSIVFFHAPADVQAKGVQPGTRFRLGGLVQEGSIKRGENQEVSFVVMDARSAIPVRYQGMLPDLFREGQGSSPKGRSTPLACSRPTRSWPATTKPTCRARSPTPSRRRAIGKASRRTRRSREAAERLTRVHARVIPP